MRFSRFVAPRRLILPVLVLLATAPAEAAAAPTPPFSDSDYWALADHLAPGLQIQWSEPLRAYANGGKISSVRVNGAMLVTHAIAALEGHAGPTRQDERARVLADRLSATPVWLGSASVSSGRGPLSTCWGMSMERSRPQHPSLEPKVADALAWAWRARRTLGLRRGVVRRIEQRVSACAHSTAWRYPARVANQINWNAELYASATTVSGRRDLLVGDYRRLLASFAAGITRPAPGHRTSNLGRGYQFHYQPKEPDTAGINLDSPEYANIVMHAVTHYDRALRLGMRPLSSTAMTRMRAWATRLIAGGWTHAGYLNWDTGKGQRRWHSAQYWAFAQQGLLAIATSPRLRGAEVGRWAKALFDRGLQLHRRMADEHGAHVAPPRMFGVASRMESYDVFGSRLVANIARAIALGMGTRPAADPPPLYSYDYDTGRLAVTTPTYSTAIVPDNRGAFPYGGIELARLFGPGQQVAANLGGRPPGTFGIVVTDRSGRTVLASQNQRGRLRLVRSPQGRPLSPTAYPTRPYAGPFHRLQAVGTVARGALRIRSTHDFRRHEIVSGWRVTCTSGCEGYRVTAYFPTYGKNSVVETTLRSGRAIRMAGPGARAGAQVRLSEMTTSALGGPGASYTVSRVTAPRDTRLFTVGVAGEATNPEPGPSLAMELHGRGTLRTILATVRIVPRERFSTTR